MFVAIDNIDMDALKVEEWINTNRDANGGVISPEFAMEILTKTNHFAHIKKVLKNITKACSDENGALVVDKVLPYKDFILSVVDGREMSPQAMDDLKELAKSCNCVDELKKIDVKPKYYDKFGYRYVYSEYDLEALSGSNLKLHFMLYRVFLYDRDLSQIEAFKFKSGAEVYLSGTTNLPKFLDFSECSKVNLSCCDLSEIEEIKFRPESEVVLKYTENLPSDLDVSMCSKVALCGCDLGGFKELKFKEGAEVNLYGAKNLPQYLDLSMCSEVTLSECDLSMVKEIKLKKKTRVFLTEAKNYEGKIVYIDDDKPAVAGINKSGMEM